MEDGRLKLGSKAGGQCDKGFSTADRIVQTEITQISDVERRTSNVERQASEAVNPPHRCSS